MRRTGSVVVLVVGVVLAGWWWAGRPDDAPQGRRTPRATPSPSIGRAPDGRPPPACAGHDPRPADLDGDGRPDWVYLDWIEEDGSGRAVFGWCMEGRHGSFATPGMAEYLSVLDLYVDGRQEALFGGNTCCGYVLRLAAYSRGRVRMVARPNGEPLVLSSGLSSKNGRDRWTVYGCDLSKGGGGALTQLVAWPRGEELRVHRTRYEVDGTTARVIDREAETVPDPGPRVRGRDVSEMVAGCVEILESS